MKKIVNIGAGKKYPDGITAEQVKIWKDQYKDAGGIKMATLPVNEDETEFFGFIFRRPDRQVSSNFEKFMDKNPDKAKEILIKNCGLTGVDEVLKNDVMFFAAANAIAEWMPVYKSEVKNL